jgi:hypothetical protein
MGANIDPDSVSSGPPAYKPKHFKKVSDNIFVIQATLRKQKLWKTSRNMVIIRNQEELTLINAVRLNRDGEEILQRLGFVGRVVRLGTSSGAEDDLHYKNYHGAQIWAPGNSTSYGAPIDRIFDEDSVLPIARSKIFVFKNSLEPEAAILIQASENQKNGLLLTSEALQNQVHNHLLSCSSRTAMRVRGMMESNIVISPKWLKSHQDKLPLRHDFERLLRLDFTRLISSRGAIVPLRAKEEAVLAVEMAFPVW